MVTFRNNKEMLGAYYQYMEIPQNKETRREHQAIPVDNTTTGTLCGNSRLSCQIMSYSKGNNIIAMMLSYIICPF